MRRTPSKTSLQRSIATLLASEKVTIKPHKQLRTVRTLTPIELPPFVERLAEILLDHLDAAPVFGPGIHLSLDALNERIVRAWRGRGRPNSEFSRYGTILALHDVLSVSPIRMFRRRQLPPNSRLPDPLLPGPRFPANCLGFRKASKIALDLLALVERAKRPKLHVPTVKARFVKALLNNGHRTALLHQKKLRRAPRCPVCREEVRRNRSIERGLTGTASRFKDEIAANRKKDLRFKKPRRKSKDL